MNYTLGFRDMPASNERFGAMADMPRWIGGEKQHVTWLVASAGSPPMRQAATTLVATLGQRGAKTRQDLQSRKSRTNLKVAPGTYIGSKK
jgi:hypothetical protein